MAGGEKFWGDVSEALGPREKGVLPFVEEQAIPLATAGMLAKVGSAGTWRAHDEADRRVSRRNASIL